MSCIRHISRIRLSPLDVFSGRDPRRKKDKLLQYLSSQFPGLQNKQTRRGRESGGLLS
jgi:hypothetical protein